VSNNGQRQLPAHVAIIMDGNGRWAQARGLERVQGHREGARAVRDTVETAARMGIEHLTLYAFSVANWSRPRTEIDTLMKLLVEFSKAERMDLRQNGIKVQVAGHVEELPPLTRVAVRELIRYTKHGDRLTLTLALSYGGRRDILDAARALAEQVRRGEITTDQIDEASFHAQMTTRNLPDVDLLIRTGGESRVSDFLLYEAAYAELMFLPLMWPDFGAEPLKRCIEAYMGKERRFGLTSAQVRTNGQDTARENARVLRPVVGY
jgi:undecaprenyl diphosphate synthase